MPINVNGYNVNSVSLRQHHYDGIVKNGLVLHLDAMIFNTVTGTTWFDLSGNGHHGTLTNGPTYNSANGGSIVFDGTNDYITLPTNSINTNSNFTLEFWDKRTSTNTHTLISGITQTGHLQLRYSGNYIQLLRAYITGFTFTSIEVPVNTINNIVLTRSSNTFSLYINSSFQSNSTQSYTFSLQNPVIGGNYDGTEYYVGNIYNFKYYNRILSSAEILQNYNATKWRFGL